MCTSFPSVLVKCVSLVGFSLVMLIGPTIEVTAQTPSTPFVPYFGKNRVRHDNFSWHIYTTQHFEIYYYPELEEHLERVAGYAESAYQKVSGDLKHDLAKLVPMVLFKTHSEFSQQNIISSDIPEGVAAFAEPRRDRMVLPIDEPSDRLYGLIVHELTHIFEFDIIPRSLMRRGVPLWVDEGLADYMRAQWTPMDMMTVRDAAIADIIPRMSEFKGYGGFTNPRLVYNLGHAVFEFIESRWGKEGIREFLFSLRRGMIGGGEDPFEESFEISGEEFDREFDKYLKDRFKPFRDKERPADYGRNLAPRSGRGKFVGILSIEPSPSGDLLAAVSANQKDLEYDIILISSKNGEVIRNLTSGFDQDRGYEYITSPGVRFITAPWMSWSPTTDRLAYFVRTEKKKSLVLQDVPTAKIVKKIEMVDVDEPESPDISPNGRTVILSALQNGIGDIFLLDLATEELTNLTNDEFGDYAPTFSPDGNSIVYVSRISGNDKLFRMDLRTKEKKQLTFGTHDDSGAQFIDNNTIVFSSTALDPEKMIDVDLARNGAIFNIWTLDLRNGQLNQYTDALGGNLSPVTLRRDDPNKNEIAFVTYFKGDFGLHTITTTESLSTVESNDFGSPGPIIDFRAPLTHTLIADNSRKKGTFENIFLEGRPPVSFGITSGGDLFGGTTVTLTDILGDQQFNFYASSISQYRTLSVSYLNLSKRFQYAAQGFSQTQFYFGRAGVFYDSAFSFLDRDNALAVRTQRGGSLFGIYPFNKYRRLEVSGGVVQQSERFNDPDLENFSQNFQRQQFGTALFNNGTLIPLSVTFIQETTIFREFGPLDGNTVRLSFTFSPKIGNTLSRQTLEADARYYQRIGTTGVLAFRARGFLGSGDYPDFIYFGGNSEMRGYEYLEFIGHKAFFLNAELRFPLIEAMLTPFGVMGGVRGVFFANFGGAAFNEQPFNLWTSGPEMYTPVTSSVINPNTNLTERTFGEPTEVSGFRLTDTRASYGIGFETFTLGIPIHLDWSWRTLFNKEWEDLLFAANGGSSTFRRAKFDIWIGFDF